MLESLANHLVNTLLDQVFRGQAAYQPATIYVGLCVANEGAHATSTTYPAASYITALTSDGNYHLYYSALGGTSAGTAPTFPGIPGETVSDGTVSWVEQTANVKSGAAISEPTIGSGAYARVPVTASLANWAGTQGAGSTTASTGTSGTTSNNNTVAFAQPTGSWAASPAVVWACALYDAASGGNLLAVGPVSNPQSVISSSAIPTFTPGALALFLA